MEKTSIQLLSLLVKKDKKISNLRQENGSTYQNLTHHTEKNSTKNIKRIITKDLAILDSYEHCLNIYITSFCRFIHRTKNSLCWFFLSVLAWLLISWDLTMFSSDSGQYREKSSDFGARNTVEMLEIIVMHIFSKNKNDSVPIFW